MEMAAPSLTLPEGMLTLEAHSIRRFLSKRGEPNDLSTSALSAHGRGDPGDPDRVECRSATLLATRFLGVKLFRSADVFAEGRPRPIPALHVLRSRRAVDDELSERAQTGCSARGHAHEFLLPAPGLLPRAPDRSRTQPKYSACRSLRSQPERAAFPIEKSDPRSVPKSVEWGR